MRRSLRPGLLAAMVALAMLLNACARSTATTTGVTSTAVPEAPITATTTIPAPTTTAAPLAPVAVLSDGALLGWWSDAGWQNDPDYAPLDDGDEYRIFSVTEPEVQSVAGPPLIHCEWVSDAGTGYQVALAPVSFGLGVSAHARASGGRAESIEPGAVHLSVAHEVLDERGADHEDPVFVQLIRTDLDHDGSAEVLGVLERGAGSFPSLGDYGVAVVMFEGMPGLAPIVLAEHVVNELPDDGIDDWFYTATVFRFDAVADVNGDGVDEVAMSSRGYEWWGTELYEWRDERDGFASVLANGCGV
jgi:hypothetical protein